jgi:hypothetical protein
MNINVTTDFSQYLNQTLNFCIDFESDEAQVELTLPALKVKNNVEVKSLTVTNSRGQNLPFTVMDDTLSVCAPSFRIAYAIQSHHSECVGSDKEVDFLYPFFNSEELFVGSGAIPYPAHLAALDERIQSQFHFTNLPSGWQMFSNLTSGRISPAALDSFFVYCAMAQNLHQHVFSGVNGQIAFQLCVQHGKTIPITLEDLWQYLDTYCDWLEHHLAPLSHLQRINILVLQAPPNFAELSNGRSFATGENMLNGIAVYAPIDPEYLQRIFKHGSYSYFLYDGLTHELMHYCTTKAWQGKYKSVLYPAADCPPHHARLIGETLNFYFHDQYVRRYFSGSDEQFVVETVARAIQMEQHRQQPNPLLSLFLLDTYLHSMKSSLLALFRHMLERQRSRQQPYDSAEILFDVLQEDFGISLPVEYREMLWTTKIADTAMIETALHQLGYVLIQNQDKYRVEKQV